MAVSKRLRFEVLRRDNHTCRYCGRSAPGVQLTVDHVVPVALGGTDTADNLVAACSDCNSGKSSAAPDQHLVAKVSDDSVRWAAALRQAAEENRLHDNSAVYDAVISAWTSYRRDQIPKDYRQTIDQFLAAGLPADDIVQMAHVADAKPSIYNRWSYFCGCCWSRIRKLQERAQEIVAGDLAPPRPLLTTSWTRSDIRVGVAFAEQCAEESRFAASSVYCKHKEPGDVPPYCDDPVCQIAWSVEVEKYSDWTWSKRNARERRDDAVMSELDRLELIDG
ncbi:HNH endonuclease, putative [Mycobacteroides abscessus subsp. massiliense]|uniref:HNH endonuclease n=1 Tax=Mycobacteroides abscessus TaxID=36809 RepID=UPI0009A6CE30|nr:HNH endonuclease [Mycobacteroides abscessus]SKD35918.1 HNH endonuclease, putative [Mycobacteroides abscessus subsp. massiliense]SKD36067.1 HNH endonuclease, putative [Mycobacteroides abscessus subsp. massiliense]SKD47532.1 HNH endonuclease, putative [Mycobacteroides abscessus subsp. massiliense]SKD50133.1 HNH endonuclease, putative [Mycobacteroides abscessus subsp. massiliense]SKD59361.1 HNH endonuclease, putative [Mycobacteroides abscessus subsp. massiliense]